jgi:hypothetical protein
VKLEKKSSKLKDDIGIWPKSKQTRCSSLATLPSKNYGRCLAVTVTDLRVSKVSDSNKVEMNVLWRQMGIYWEETQQLLAAINESHTFP